MYPLNEENTRGVPLFPVLLPHPPKSRQNGKTFFFSLTDACRRKSSSLGRLQLKLIFSRVHTTKTHLLTDAYRQKYSSHGRPRPKRIFSRALTTKKVQKTYSHGRLPLKTYLLSDAYRQKPIFSRTPTARTHLLTGADREKEYSPRMPSVKNLFSFGRRPPTATTYLLTDL